MKQLVGERVHLRPIVRLAIRTMLRKSELLGLRKENFDFERDLIWVVNAGGQKTESKKSRPVPMNSVARQILLGLYRANPSEFVFPNGKTGSHVKDVKTAFGAACRAAKLNDLRFHDLRRTGATRLGEGGVDAFYIAAILGHADVNTSQVYTVATNTGLRRAMGARAARARTDRRDSPHTRRTAVTAGRRILLKLLVAGGRLELPTLGL